jgi:hypothetical protein
VTLEEHDRSLYDTAAAAEADELVRGALAEGPGPYALEAAISCLHTLAPTYVETDWGQIAAFYGLLMRSDPSPVIALNRALAVSFAERPEAAAPLLADLDGRLAGYAPFHAACADVQRRQGNDGAARAAYERALALTGNAGERELLARRLRARIAARGSGGAGVRDFADARTVVPATTRQCVGTAVGQRSRPSGESMPLVMNLRTASSASRRPRPPGLRSSEATAESGAPTVRRPDTCCAHHRGGARGVLDRAVDRYAQAPRSSMVTLPEAFLSSL